MEQPKCSVSCCSSTASIHLSSIEHRAIVGHVGVCREHANDVLTREREKVVSGSLARADYAGAANVDLRFVLFDTTKQPHEGPATIELSEVGATGRLVIGRIGFCESWALDTALKQLAVSRPLTHPLMAQIIGALGAQVDRVAIDQLDRRQESYHAKLHLSHGTEPVFVDCRPSDALVVAVICGAPIFAARDLLVDQRSAAAELEQVIRQP